MVRNKKELKIVAVLFVAMIILVCLGMTIETRQEPWLPLRTAVTIDDTALDGTTAGYTYKFSDKPAKAAEVPASWNSIDIHFYGTDAANEVCNYKIYGWKDNGPALLMASGAATLGAAVTGAATTYYADTMTETDMHAVSAVTDSAADRVCVLHLTSIKGISWIYCELDVTTCASMSCEMTGY